MKRLTATIILAIIAMAIAGCDVTYHRVRHYRGHRPRGVIVTRAPAYCPPPPPWYRRHGHHHPRHWRRH